MEDTLDTGPILSQIPLPVLETDTSASLYERGLEALWHLYLTSALRWLRGLETEFHPQQGIGSRHSVADLERLTNLEMTSSLSLARAIKWLRARTFGACNGAQFQIENETYRVTVQICGINEVAE